MDLPFTGKYSPYLQICENFRTRESSSQSYPTSLLRIFQGIL